MSQGFLDERQTLFRSLVRPRRIGVQLLSRQFLDWRRRMVYRQLAELVDVPKTKGVFDIFIHALLVIDLFELRRSKGHEKR
jgi:hypothetical protein